MSRVRANLAFLAASLVALVVAHNLDYLVTYGEDAPQALLRSGHGPEWSTAVAVVLGGAVCFVVLMARRFRGLRALASQLDATGTEPALDVDALRRTLAGHWLRITALTTVLFVVQENIEHLATGNTLPGLAVLGWVGDPHALIVIATVALAVSFTVVLYRFRRDVLIRRIESALRRLYHYAERLEPPTFVDIDRRPESIVGRRRAGRAPPILARP